ncbi:MAG: hypothetical protein FJY76_01660 [Candidatus Aenigmarchaeota archaeon]|nr:hypothetical protein [Candidatus Aenigmarchaeota archaeon]
MAEKPTEKVEKIVTIPLRAGWLKEPRGDRTKRSIYEIRHYVFRHTGAGDVKVSKLVNELIWRKGIQKPPGSVKVKLSVSKDTARVMLPDEKEEVVEEKKGAAASLKGRLMGKPAPTKPAAASAAAKAEAPKEERAAQQPAAREAPAPANTSPKK